MNSDVGAERLEPGRVGESWPPGTRGLINAV
jgi:hypothetical protein